MSFVRASPQPACATTTIRGKLTAPGARYLCAPPSRSIEFQHLSDTFSASHRTSSLRPSLWTAHSATARRSQGRFLLHSTGMPKATMTTENDDFFREKPFELGYVTDVEGNLDYFRRCVQTSSCAPHTRRGSLELQAELD